MPSSSGSGAGVCRRGRAESCDYKAFGLDAAKFFIYLTKDTPYAQVAGLAEPGGRHARQRRRTGRLSVAYVNPAAYESITKKENMAYGSLIVMENRGADQKLRNLTARIKIKGYNPKGGDWYWFALPRWDGDCGGQGGCMHRMPREGEGRRLRHGRPGEVGGFRRQPSSCAPC